MALPERPGEAGARTEDLELDGSYRVVTIRKCKLAVSEGPDRGQSFHLDAPKIRIGTHADNEVRLTDSSVSRHHAVIERRREGYLVRDTGSRNGTFLEGLRVNDAFLPPGAHVRVGRTELVFHPRDEDLLVTPATVDDFHGLRASSRAMREVTGILERVAPTEVSVIVRGETGTGKEVVARAIHAASHRAAGPFVVLDCGNLNPELVGSEIFGHEPGAFTGAAGRRIGAIEQADGGTLFLDEIGEMPLELQPRLLRALEQREIQRLGGSAPRKVDVRLVAATHRDLDAMVAEGRFREDLYYRMAQVEIELPPLRERPEDVPLLARYFLDQATTRMAGRKTAGFTAETLRILREAPWRGNVRELRNVVERALALCPGESIEPGDLMLRERTPAAGPAEAAPAPATDLVNRSLEDIEREAILQTLRAHDGNKTRASAVLGIATITLREKMKRYGIADADVKKPG